MKKAIFAGSFDPLHEGHKKIIKKAASIFDLLYVVVANNDVKKYDSSLATRFSNVKQEIQINNVQVSMLEDKYLATFAKKENIKFLVRSARNNTDFEYELSMAKENRKLNTELETILVIPDYDDIKYNSTKIRKFKAKEQ